MARRWTTGSFVLSVALSWWIAAPPARGAEPVSLGLIYDLSSDRTARERPLLDAVHLAIDEINASGGVLGRPLSPLLEDGGVPGKTAEKALRLLVDDAVPALFGCSEESAFDTAVPLVEAHGSLLWRALPHTGQPVSPAVVHVGPALNQLVTPAVTWAAQHLGTRFFLVGSDTAFSRSASRVAHASLPALHAECVGEVELPEEGASIERLVDRIEESHADVILSTIQGRSNPAFFQKLAGASMRASQVPVLSLAFPERKAAEAGSGVLQRHYWSATYFSGLDTPENRAFVAAYRRRYGHERIPDEAVEAAYVQVHLFAAAVRRAGTLEAGGLRRALKDLTFAAPGGPVTLDGATGMAWRTARIAQMQRDGSLRIVWSSEGPVRPDPLAGSAAEAPGR